MIARLTAPDFTAELGDNLHWTASLRFRELAMNVRFNPRTEELSPADPFPRGHQSVVAAAAEYGADIEWEAKQPPPPDVAF